MRGGGAFPHVGEQFELDLFPAVPWSGMSPRSLTRVGQGLFSRPEPPKPRGEAGLSDQLEFWPAVGPHRERGRRNAAAPFLLEYLNQEG